MSHNIQILADYRTESFFDEMFTTEGDVRPAYRIFFENLERLHIDELKAKQYAADKSYVTMGITFNVYHEGEGVERTLPFDLVPRIIPLEEWEVINRGLTQRVITLNTFLDDIYNKKLILKDKMIPEEIIRSSPGYLAACENFSPPKGRWAHISGIDLIKHIDGQYYVLEDNCRVPSGVSYVLENREIMKRAFPNVFERSHVQPISDYPLQLLEMLQSLTATSSVGRYNCAGFY